MRRSSSSSHRSRVSCSRHRADRRLPLFHLRHVAVEHVRLRRSASVLYSVPGAQVWYSPITLPEARRSINCGELVHSVSSQPTARSAVGEAYSE